MNYQPFYVCLDESVFISLFYLFVGSIFARGENKLNQIDNLHNDFLPFFIYLFFIMCMSNRTCTEFTHHEYS